MLAGGCLGDRGFCLEVFRVLVKMMQEGRHANLVEKLELRHELGCRKLWPLDHSPHHARFSPGHHERVEAGSIGAAWSRSLLCYAFELLAEVVEKVTVVAVAVVLISTCAFFLLCADEVYE